MKRIVLAAGFVFLALASSPRRAEGGIVDWMQSWSGPGPFHHRIPPLFSDFCNQEQSFNRLSTVGVKQATKTELETAARKYEALQNRMTALSTEQSTTKAALRQQQINAIKERRSEGVAGQCVYIDYRDLENTKDPNKSDYDDFPIGVRVKMFTVGITRRVAFGKIQKSISAGAGGGFVFASGEGPTGKTMIAPYIEFPRVVLKPLLLFAELNDKDHSDRLENWLSIWQVHFSGGVIIGPFGAQDLGVDPAVSSFQRNLEFVSSRGVLVIDGARFLRAIGVYQH